MNAGSGRAFAVLDKNLYMYFSSKGAFLFDSDNLALYCILTTLALELGRSRFVSRPLLETH